LGCPGEVLALSVLMLFILLNKSLNGGADAVNDLPASGDIKYPRFRADNCQNSQVLTDGRGYLRCHAIGRHLLILTVANTLLLDV